MAVANGRYIFLLGGIDAAGSTVDSVYRLDPSSGSTKLAGTVAAPTHGGAALLLGQRAFVFGGVGPPVSDLVQEYDPASAVTRVVGHLPAQRADLAAAVVGKQVIVAAGFDGAGPLDRVLGTTDAGHVRLVAHLPQAVRYPAVAVVANRSTCSAGWSPARAELYPQWARRIAARYPIGNHTFDHTDLRLPLPSVAAELGMARAAIKRATGRPPVPLFRFPYGSSNASTLAVVNRFGDTAVGWTVDTLGWEGTSLGQSVQSVVSRALSSLQPGEIILMHVGANPDHSTLDPDALARIIRGFVHTDTAS